MLSSLAKLYSDTRANIQAKAIDMLFELLKQYGSNFTPEFWKLIIKGVLRPFFDEIQYSF